MELLLEKGGAMSNSIPSVGLIGLGFVGGAHAAVFKHYTDVKIYDIDERKCTHDYLDVISQDVLFLCLPTPMLKGGGVDISFIEKALADLEDAACTSPIIIKSTISPENLEVLYAYPTNLVLIYSPEFLTERTAELDLQNSTRFIFGVDTKSVYSDKEAGRRMEAESKVQNLFDFRFPRVPQHWIDFRQASLVKYFANAFFACKIALLNEFFDIAEAVGVDGQGTIDLMLLDQRIGRSHHLVPGTDGKRGFGGTCFPKDLRGLTRSAAYWGVSPTMLMAAWDVNLRVRPEKDWEQDVGRAITKKENDDEV